MPSPAPPSRRTVAAFLRWWIRDVAPVTVRATTAAAYSTVVHHRLVPAFGARTLVGLTGEEIQTYLAGQLRAGRSPWTVRQTLRVLRIALEHAKGFGLVAENVARRVPTPRVPRALVVPLSPAAVRGLLRRAEGRPVELAVVLGLSGLRAGEIRGLRWEDLDLRRRLAQVRRTAQWAGNGLLIVPPKTAASLRTIKLPAFAVRPLRCVPRRERHGYLYAGPPPNGSAPSCPPRSRPPPTRRSGSPSRPRASRAAPGSSSRPSSSSSPTACSPRRSSSPP